MSESLFYNRDNNISGITVPSTIGALNLTPVYGSQVNFQATNNSYNTDDFYYNLVPYSVNSLTAQFNVRYDVNETNAQRLAVFFENQSGVEDIPFTPDSSNIYKTVTGFCNNYAINFINNQHYEVASTISVDHAPTLLKWSGMGCFANLNFDGWSPATTYKKYNVVYSGLNQNKLDNFYYCTGDHSSTESNSPTGVSSMWSQKFFFEPDIGTQNDVTIKADVLQYKNSFKQRLKTNDNISTFDISYSFNNISDSQTKSMIHFLENKGGYRRFEHQIPSVYNRPKVYYCPKWTHTWNYVNSNTLTVDFVEDPLGVIPTGT
jgi:phage-related protein